MGEAGGGLVEGGGEAGKGKGEGMHEEMTCASGIVF
jgi:hypothetical protein